MKNKSKGAKVKLGAFDTRRVRVGKDKKIIKEKKMHKKNIVKIDWMKFGYAKHFPSHPFPNPDTTAPSIPQPSRKRELESLILINLAGNAARFSTKINPTHPVDLICIAR